MKIAGISASLLDNDLAVLAPIVEDGVLGR
jgi:hypothetical protein